MGHQMVWMNGVFASTAEHSHRQRMQAQRARRAATQRQQQIAMGCPNCGGELARCSPSGAGVAACDACGKYWESVSDLSVDRSLFAYEEDKLAAESAAKPFFKRAEKLAYNAAIDCGVDTDAEVRVMVNGRWWVVPTKGEAYLGYASAHWSRKPGRSVVEKVTV